MERNNRHSASVIAKIIAFLKSQKISQQEIESRLNYSSLSKAKNYDRYPQVIIEKKTRPEILEQLCKEFSLKYDDHTEIVGFVEGGDIAEVLMDVEYYIMHYYAFAREMTNRALVKIVNKRKVSIDYHVDDEHWEGIFSVIENYTFLELTKMGYTTPVKKLMSLFSGTMKYGRPILLGSYSTVKRDGYPAAGKVVLEKADSLEEAQKMMQEESDYRIRGFLRNNVHVTRTHTPTSLDDLSFNYMDEYMRVVGPYKILYADNNGIWSEAFVEIRSDYSATLLINDVKYLGSISLYNADSIAMRFRRKKIMPSEPTAYLLNIELNIRSKAPEGYYSGVGTSPTLHVQPSSFSCYLCPEEISIDSIKENLDHHLFIAKV